MKRSTEDREHDLPLPDGDERLADWVDGRMTARELERFEAEMRVNPRLQQEAEEYRRGVEAVRDALREPMPAVDLAQRVLAQIASQPAAPPAPRHLRRPWLLSLAVAAGLLLTVWLVQETGAPTPERTPSADRGSDTAFKDAAKDAGRAGWTGTLAGGAETPAAAADRPQADPAEALQRLLAEGGVTPDRAQRDTAPGKAGELQELRAGAEDERGEAVANGRQLVQTQAAQAEQQPGADDYFLGRSRAGRPTGKAAAAAGAPAEADPQAAATVAEEAAEPQAERERLRQEAPWAAQLRMQTAAEPTVQVVVLTRRLQQAAGQRPENKSGPAVRTRSAVDRKTVEAPAPSAPGSDAADAVDPAATDMLLLQQFPTLRAPQQGQAPLDLGIAGIQLQQIGSLDAAVVPGRIAPDQAREWVGNFAPHLGQVIEPSLRGFVPDGARANAFYVSGQPAQMRVLLQQVASWADRQQVELSLAEMPAASLVLFQQAIQPADRSPGGAGQPAGPATPGAARGDPEAGVTATGLPTPTPTPAPAPDRAEPRAVVLVFREVPEQVPEPAGGGQRR